MSESFQLVPIDRRPEALGDLRVLPDELICAILEDLSPRDLAHFSCVSSVMYILCNEEPLWMTQCLKSVSGPVEYKGSWKKTTLYQQHVPDKLVECCGKSLHFDGFNSLFLYKRFYRCFTTLNAFSADGDNVEKKKDLSQHEFHNEYDGRKPVLITELAETWPARSTWTSERLLHNFGDTKFKISQRSSGKITMKFKDYVSYMELQHDEDPLYIFDDKFGEVAPSLLKDYSVPHLFQEDFFDVLDRDQRPPFRWLIIGPERSGASWHVDPALTSAWNTLLCGRKRWALYPPGRVPLGVTVHVSEEDGDVNIDTPSSLQWWLDIYPMLAEQDKPIECTQLPGETIYVPSGWWHCVLNLETTIAVTQNFVNSKNFEFVCLDMAPGHRHKGVCRAGLLAIDVECSEGTKVNATSANDKLNYPDMIRREKRLRVSENGESPFADDSDENATHGLVSNKSLQIDEFSYDIDFLAMFLEAERDHYISIWSPSNCIGQREMRQWLHKLWVEKPGIRDLIWKGACLALNADKWSECMEVICTYHNLPTPLDDEKLPVGTGSNPVYLTEGHVIKIYVEEGLECSIHGLGTELEFYSLLRKVSSPLKDHIPDVLASGILFQENGSYGIVEWDGKGVPDVIAKCSLIKEKCPIGDFPFGVWSKKQFELHQAGMPINERFSSARSTTIWPYLITKRCRGDIFAHLRDILSLNDGLNLASFLGDQLRNLHVLPVPPYNYFNCDKQKLDNEPSVDVFGEAVHKKISVPGEWWLFIETLTRRKKDVSSRLAKWGDPIPIHLIEKVEDYVPDDLSLLLNMFKDEKGIYKVCKSSSWIHSDIMDDNIYMDKCSLSSSPVEHAMDVGPGVNGTVNGVNGSGEQLNWHPSHILDFSDLSIGDPIYDLIPIHVDVFRGDADLLKRFLETYKLPFLRKSSQYRSFGTVDKFDRLSYHAMCYCILHEDNVLGAIFGMCKELKTAKSWEDVEEIVWGELNKYEGFVDQTVHSA
ncbi:Bifunctional arginine demethylase and lysyl-hydroxylase jmjd6 [Thalictrum thalictroides]|uniref:Bifunctional arginine demethylase and lysyl-hydroxylase jmjd6 n=1 Tax=Thalictrum thalictroides TaxID=46969 RepID=A0A7J6W751_THATH|nr:Bifunctional arginine demethylase and lysyl-hydroxylase jmjd6 [Thalictrum thalictroides]